MMESAGGPVASIALRRARVSEGRVCNFATLAQLIEDEGVSGPISSGIEPCFPGMFILNASAGFGEAAAGACWFGTGLRVKTAGWEGGVALVMNEAYA